MLSEAGTVVLVSNETNRFVILVCYLFSCNEETKHNTVTLFSELKTLLLLQKTDFIYLEWNFFGKKPR